jgi:ribosomal protein L12E/L44/L45/RPP1/RPP2
MAVPSSRSRANASSWATINKQRAEANKPKEEKKEEQVTEEEHKKRLEMLKQLGILKE